jgi:hypothetical protein
MRSIEDMRFSAEATRNGSFIGRVYEFPQLRTSPKRSRLDAIDEIITLTVERIREIHDR